MILWLLHILHEPFHLGINYIIARAVFRFDCRDALIVMIGGLLIDLDHLLYILYLLFWRKYSVDKVARESFLRVRNQIPAFFIFHTFEFLLLMLIIGILFSENIYFLSIGFLLHNLTDIVFYVLKYKSYNPWIKFFSITSYIANYKYLEKESYDKLQEESMRAWDRNIYRQT